MPNRIIKDSIRTSKSVNTMSDFQFRLWVYLLTYVDDYGRGSADPELLKGFVFPRRKGVTEATIEKSLQELANIGSILLYDVDGESYFCFPNWADHQRIQTKKSRFPSPDDGALKISTVSHGESPSESNPIQSNPNTESESNPSFCTPAHARGDTQTTRKRFFKPTIDQIREYCQERNNGIDPERFFDFYESKGWVVGKQPMKDWKACIRTWEKSANNSTKQSEETSNPFLAMLHDMDRQETADSPLYADFTEVSG